MKNILKLSLFGILGLVLFTSCEEDEDFNYPVDWDHTELSFEQSVVFDNDVHADITYTASGEGVIYYAIVNDAWGVVPTAQNLREEFGLASGAGLSNYLEGGSFVVDGDLSETISIDLPVGGKYTVYSTAANGYDYVSELHIDQLSVYWDHSEYSYEQELVYNGGGKADVNYTSDEIGVVYYAIVNDADIDEAPTPESLREEFGEDVGPGFSGYIEGGAITFYDDLTEVISFDVYDNNSYTIYSTGANNYADGLMIDHIDIDCPQEVSTSYNSYAYSDELGLTVGSAVEGNTSVIPVPNEDNLYYVESLWGDSFVAFLAGDASLQGQYVYPAILEVHEDNSVTILNAGGLNDGYVQGGTGEYDPCRNTFNLVLEQGLFTTPFTVNVILSTE